MSKLSFRARALDASKPMPVYKTEEIPDLPDFAAINRAVPQMPTGMEKEEETEHHLQRALSAQQVYGTAEALVIPIPDIDTVTPNYKKLYEKDGGYKPPRQYIHVQPFGMDQEIPDYDMDSEDEGWLNKQSRKLEVTPLKFETMMDRLEKGSGQTVMTLNEAKALLKEDDDLIIAVYDYWLNKRLKLQRALIPTVRTEKRDGSSTNNPYVAFRRRTEKMQTRKNRKNDEVSYEKMLKLRRDLNKALTVLELMKRREKSKKELLKLTIEIVEKRYQMQDFDGKVYSEANAKRHTLPSTFIQSYNEYINARKWADRVSRQEEQTYAKKSSKRKYNKRKEQQHRERSHGHINHVTGGHVTSVPQVALSREREPAVNLPQYTEVDVLQDPYSSEEELSPQLSASDHEQESSESDPDGTYAFKRKPGCQYHAPIDPGRGNWPWYGQEDGGIGDTKYRYSVSSLSQPRPRCFGFGRRRIGRGGRVLFDRMPTDWDDTLDGLDITSTGDHDDIANTYKQHLSQHQIPHFRPRTPTDEELYDSHLFNTSTPSVPLTEFSIETYEHHREQLIQMTRAERLAQDSTPGSVNSPGAFSSSHVGFHSYCSDLSSSIGGNNNNGDILAQSFSSQPNSKFTLDSERAQFAASAVCRSMTSQSTTSQSVNIASSTPDTVVTSSNSLHSSQAGSSDVTSSQSIVAPCLSGSHSSRTNSPLVFQNGPAEVKPSVFSTSPAANVLQLNYPISDSSRVVTSGIKSPSLLNNSNQSSATSISLVKHQNISNNANSSNTISLATQGNSASSLAQSLATGGISLITQNNDHNRLLNSTNRFPVVSVATKCVSPATPTLLKFASTAQVQNHNRDTLEGASLLKDKVTVMEVT